MSMRYKRKFPIAVANVTAVMEGMQFLPPRAYGFPDVPCAYIMSPVSAPVCGLHGLLQISSVHNARNLARIVLLFPCRQGH